MEKAGALAVRGERGRQQEKQRCPETMKHGEERKMERKAASQIPMASQDSFSATYAETAWDRGDGY